MSWRRIVIGAALILSAGRGAAFDSHCGFGTQTCADGLAAARTRWGVSAGGAAIDEHAEHARLWVESFAVSGLPPALAGDLELPVFTGDEVVAGHPTVQPTLRAARRRQVRVTSHAELTQLPDFSYTLWDWALGNETCPPGPLNPEICHQYFPHIGMLNSNHMVPQSERFYAHYHRLAVQRAADCLAIHDGLPAAQRERFRPLVLACEKEALAIEAVGQHFLQDSWSMGHMWERWGGPEFTDFGAPPLGDRTLGAAVAAYTGIIHGGASMLPPGFDDPMCAPHPGVTWIDGAGGAERLGVGDVFLDEVLLPASGDAGYGPQRRALFGCAVDGMRTVYAQTARLHGPLGAPNATVVDTTRQATGASCFGQRATNQALAIGFGLHRGTYPNQVPLLEVYPGLADPGVTNESFPAGVLAFALATFAPQVGLPALGEEEAARFARDAAAAATVAAARGADPQTGLLTDLAAGGLPAIAGIEPNHRYARGSATEPPSTYADPFLPWPVFADDPDVEQRTRALNLLFADAHAADRCLDFAEADLLDYRTLSEAAAGGNAAVAEARCEQCATMVLPHLRFGTPGAHEPRLEAFCAFAGGAGTAFVYSDQDPAEVADDLPSLHDATRRWCGCGSTTTTTTSTTSTTLPGAALTVSCTAGVSIEVQVDDGFLTDGCNDGEGTSLEDGPSDSGQASCSAMQMTAAGTGNGAFSVTLVSGSPTAVPGTYSASGVSLSANVAGNVSGGTRGVASASGRVRCSMSLNVATPVMVLASGAFGGGDGYVEIEFQRVNGPMLGLIQEAHGTSVNTFPVQGPLAAGDYRIEINALAAANRAREASAGAGATFDLTLGAP